MNESHRPESPTSFGTNLKSLECFRAVVDTGSATAAARLLNMSQPGVSRLLGVLEKQLGFRLFHRRHGRLFATAEGLSLYKEVDIALSSVDHVAQLAQNLKNADFGELTMVAPPSLAEGVLSSVIAAFLKDHPNVRVSLDSHSVERARDMVALRAVDCGFVKLPAEFPGIECRPLVTSGTVCAMARGHPLASKTSVNVKDLRDQPLILLGKGKASRTQIDEAFRKAGVRMKVRMETHTVGAACASARHGVGIAIANELLAMQFRSRSLVLKRFEPNFQHEYAFMTASDLPMNRVTREFFECCRRYFKDRRDVLMLSDA